PSRSSCLTTQSNGRDDRPHDGAALSLRPGPRWVRTAGGTAGSRRARAVMLGECGSQVTGGPPLRPRPAEQYWTGFEPLTELRDRGLALVLVAWAVVCGHRR